MQSSPARGVTVPANQGRPANEGSPNTVISAMRCTTVLVEYFDQNGRRTTDALIEANGNYYRPDNSIAWAGSLKAVNPWLVAGTAKKLPLQNVQVVDNVEVLDAGIPEV
jgi:flagella basal body P-ring formation protein FlgA